MGQFTQASNNVRYSSEPLTKRFSTITLETAGKYVDQNLALGIDIPGMNLQKNQTFYINDGIYTWNWSVDSNGNVTIT